MRVLLATKGFIRHLCTFADEGTSSTGFVITLASWVFLYLFATGYVSVFTPSRRRFVRIQPAILIKFTAGQSDRVIDFTGSERREGVQVDSIQPSNFENNAYVLPQGLVFLNVPAQIKQIIQVSRSRFNSNSSRCLPIADRARLIVRNCASLHSVQCSPSLPRRMEETKNSSCVELECAMTPLGAI